MDAREGSARIPVAPARQDHLHQVAEGDPFATLRAGYAVLARSRGADLPGLEFAVGVLAELELRPQCQRAIQSRTVLRPTATSM